MPKESNYAIYTTSDFPSGRAPENLVRQLAIGLLENKVNVRVIRLLGEFYEKNIKTDIQSGNFIFKKRPKYEIIKLLEVVLTVIWTPFFVTIQKLLYKTDAIILYGVEYSYKTLPFLITCKIINIKIFRVITDHYEEKSLVPVWWKRIKILFYNRQFQTFDKYFDGIIVLSNYLKELLLSNKIMPSKILLIPHFINTSIFHKQKNNLSKKGEIFTIGFCGTAIKENGIIDLIHAFKTVHYKYENIKLLIIGSVPSEVKNIILNEFEKGIQEKIIVTGFLGLNEVVLHLNECDVLVNPRKSGRFAEAGFPTKLGEYFATKIPVISTKTADLNYYFTDKKELLFSESNNSDSIAEAIEYVILNKEKCIEIGNNGFFWALENLNYNKNSLKVKDFILESTR